MSTSFSKKLLHWLKSNFFDFFFIASLIAISSFVAFKNYTPGAFLLGWDNLVPELNFGLNIGRSLSSVWQEYQGLGILGGMAHATDFPRQLFLSILTRFDLVNESFVRYFWTFLMFSVGPLGVYYLVSRAILFGRGNMSKKIAGFVSAVFYIFNLATVQVFFVPFETFSGFFGFLPWFLAFAIQYLHEGKRKHLILFGTFSFLGAGAFYVQTLFVVFVVFLAVLSIESVIRNKKKGFVRSLKLALVTILINSFWLAPAGYFTITNAGVTTTSHINSIATPETQLMNKARSNFENIISLRGYWFDYYDWNSSGEYSLLYQDWIDYLENPFVDKIFLALFAVSAIGLVLSLLKAKKIFGISFIVLFGISYYMLSGGEVSFIPYLTEAFRNVFTKWSNAFALVLGVGVGYFVFLLGDFSFSIKNKIGRIFAQTIYILFTTVVILESVYIAFPVLQGKLISDSMKVSLPSYYPEVVNYFKNIDSSKRIAAFPFTDFWGWQFNDWGYRGSGFIWYGIPQPILSRNFDVWSPLNEQFYKEANHALFWGSVTDLERVLTKYQVSYILFDNSIVEMGNPDSFLNIEKQKSFLESSDLISRQAVFGKITIYKITLPEIYKFISVPEVDYSDLIFKINDFGTLIISEEFLEGQGYPDAKNCNLQSRGEVFREKRINGNYYRAEKGGVSCDYFYYPTLDYSKAYGMRIIGKNLEGRSLKFYLYNVAGRRVFMEELLPSGDFDEMYIILPTAVLDENKPDSEAVDSISMEGYTLNIETRSFENISSENIITAIEFYELSFERTTPITFKKLPLQSVHSILNNLQILNVKKYGTWGYRVEVEGEGLLALGQSYEKGWVALEIPNPELQITKIRRLEHTKVNGWANGWFVPNSSLSPFTIYLIYWPQVLEWAGFLAAFTTFLILVFGRRKPSAN